MFPACKYFIENQYRLLSGYETAFDEEVMTNGLSSMILIQDLAECRQYAQLTAEKEIILANEFVQYLWCVSYGLITICDKGYLEPVRSGMYSGNIELNRDSMRAIKAFEIGRAILDGRRLSDDGNTFLSSLINSIENDEYLSKSTMVFSAAIAFVIAHEIGHSYFGHLIVDPEIRHEFVADEYAKDIILMNNSGIEQRSCIIGIVLGVSSLGLLPKAMAGGREHPDVPSRIESIVRIIEDEKDPLYCIVAIMYKLWFFYDNGSNIELPTMETCKEFYVEMKSMVMAAINGCDIE